MLKEDLLFADRYRFIKQLGRGGFSEVWLAEDSLTGVQVAVKVYAPGTGLDEDGIKIFTQEFSMVFDMNHTNLLRPTHFDCWNRMPYLILPFVKNGSAFKYITKGECMPEDECWKMLHDVAAGLAYLHEKTPPLIHQDIKPDNILIDDEGRYLITDFGISARVRSTIRGAKSQEQSGGTLAYMGPERFSSNPKPIMASDVWSLGAMMYELMTGLPPFGNHGGVLQKNGADIPIIEGDYSDELKDLISSLLAKETWDRPSARKIEETTYNKLHGIVIPKEPKPESKPTIIIEESKPASPQPIPSEHPSNKIKQAESTGKSSEQDKPKELVKPFNPAPEKKSNTTDIKKSKPIGPAINNKPIIYGCIAAAVILIVILIAVLPGGTSEESQPVTVIETPRVNYDSIAQAKIQQAINIRKEADTIIAQHPDEYTDSKFNKVEDIYISSLKKLESALTDRDSLSANIATSAMEQQASIKSVLLKIYKELDAGAQFVEQFKTRADNIKPYIENLINNESQDNNE